jgi:hypothetical protein
VPHLHINNLYAYYSRLNHWLTRFNAIAAKNLPNHLGWRRVNLRRKPGPGALSETVPPNS